LAPAAEECVETRVTVHCAIKYTCGVWGKLWYWPIQHGLTSGVNKSSSSNRGVVVGLRLAGIGLRLAGIGLRLAGIGLRLAGIGLGLAVGLTLRTVRHRLVRHCTIMYQQCHLLELKGNRRDEGAKKGR